MGKSDFFHKKTSTIPGSFQKSILDREAISFMWRFARPHLNPFLWSAFLGIVIASLGIIPPWAMKKVTESFSRSEGLNQIFLWVGFGLAGVASRSGLEVLNRMVMVTLLGKITNDMRKDLYLEIQKSDLICHLKRRVGEVASIVGKEIGDAAGGVMEAFSSIWFRPLKIVFLFGVMFYFNPALAVLATVTLPVVTISISKISRRTRLAEFSFFEHRSIMVGDIVESLTNVRQVKSYGLEEQQTEKIEEQGKKLMTFRNRAVFLRSLVSPVTEITGGAVIAVMAALAYYQLNNDMTTVGDISGCLVAALSLKEPVKELSGCIVLLQRSFAAIYRIRWVCGETTETHNLSLIKPPVEKIMFENVSFSYDNRRSIFENVNLQLQRGERLALIGPSGAGKTTFLDLLSGFFPCSAGRILVDGMDLSSVDMRSWRKEIGIVSQEPFLFEGTIKENIMAGDRQASEEGIIESCRRAGCCEMLETLPDGLQTMVGERGCRLSGGERKRIAMARALVRPISVLLLDEATSELDPAIEESILEVIDQLANELIVVHSSHRTSILHHCDRALRIEDGSVKSLTEGDVVTGSVVNNG